MMRAVVGRIAEAVYDGAEMMADESAPPGAPEHDVDVATDELSATKVVKGLAAGAAAVGTVAVAGPALGVGATLSLAAAFVTASAAARGAGAAAEGVRTLTDADYRNKDKGTC